KKIEKEVEKEHDAEKITSGVQNEDLILDLSSGGENSKLIAGARFGELECKETKAHEATNPGGKAEQCTPCDFSHPLSREVVVSKRKEKCKAGLKQAKDKNPPTDNSLVYFLA
ncbi:hypothetical protein AQUCO_02500027v1, partial [Aquilegia coerulea]